MDNPAPASPAPGSPAPVAPETVSQIPELPIEEQKQYAIKVVAKQVGLSMAEATARIASWTEEKVLALAKAGREGIVHEYQAICESLKTPSPAVVAAEEEAVQVAEGAVNTAVAAELPALLPAVAAVETAVESAVASQPTAPPTSAPVAPAPVVVAPPVVEAPPSPAPVVEAPAPVAPPAVPAPEVPAPVAEAPPAA